MIINQDNQNANIEEIPSYNDKAHWILLAVCILGVMIQIDMTAVNVALVPIADTINADLSLVQWALSAYVLAWGAFVLAAGRLADLFGRRRTFLIGTLLFMLGSALTGIAYQGWSLILGRIVQGIGGALFLPGLYTLVFMAFPENKRGSALGILTSSIAIGLAIGPTFGGLILHFLNWRWIFFLNLPLGLPIIAIILWAVKKEPWRLLQESMDYIGAILIITSLFLLMFALDQIGNWGISSSKFVLSLALALLLLFIFLIYERRQVHPLIQLALFKNYKFLGASLCYIVTGFNFTLILMIGNLYLQNALDYSPLYSGLIFLVMTFMFALLSVLGGKLADRLEPQVPSVLGLSATAMGLLVFGFCTQYSNIGLPILALALVGVGVGLSFPALNTTMMKSVNQNLLSTASSVFAMFGCIGNTFGLIFGSIIIITCGQKRLTYLLSHQQMQLNVDQQQILQTVIGSTHYSPAQLTLFPSATIPDLINILRSSFVYAMSISMFGGMLLALLGIIISLFLIKPNTRHYQ